MVPASTTTFDVAAALGSPAAAFNYTLILPAANMAGGFPAIDATGLHDDSFGSLVIRGDGRGSAGDGGRGIAGTPWQFAGGGGGAGYPVGAGAEYAGADGTLTAGGAGGSGVDAFTGPITPAVDGSDAGHALHTSHDMQIFMDGGTLWGGGGGGGGSGGFVDGGDGGDLGDPGDPDDSATTVGGAGGYAVKHNRSGITLTWPLGMTGVVGSVGE